MTSARLVEAQLSPQEVQKILAVCSPRGLLVGGQALAFWADRLNVALPNELTSGVTADADFIGDSTLARDLGDRLGWKTWLPTIDDATPQTGKVTHRLPGGRVKQVDFLSGVVGLTTKDIARRAVELEVPRIGSIRVMHPIDVLDSRIQNLHILPEKRTAAGVAQARLAIDVARTFIREEIIARGERAGLKLLERIADIAVDISAVRVFVLYGIDPLQAIPLGDFHASRSLHRVRWPQILAATEECRERMRALTSRPKKAARRRRA